MLKAKEKAKMAEATAMVKAAEKISEVADEAVWHVFKNKRTARSLRLKFAKRIQRIKNVTIDMHLEGADGAFVEYCEPNFGGPDKDDKRDRFEAKTTVVLPRAMAKGEKIDEGLIRLLASKPGVVSVDLVMGTDSFRNGPIKLCKNFGSIFCENAKPPVKAELRVRAMFPKKVSKAFEKAVTKAAQKLHLSSIWYGKYKIWGPKLQW